MAQKRIIDRGNIWSTSVLSYSTLTMFHRSDKTSHRQYVNKWAWQCSNKTLSTKLLVSNSLPTLIQHFTFMYKTEIYSYV